MVIRLVSSKRGLTRGGSPVTLSDGVYSAHRLEHRRTGCWLIVRVPDAFPQSAIGGGYCTHMTKAATAIAEIADKRPADFWMTNDDRGNRQVQ